MPPALAGSGGSGAVRSLGRVVRGADRGRGLLDDDLTIGGHRDGRAVVLLVKADRLIAELLVVVEAGPCGDQLADDHVLLETAQTVDLAGDGGLGEHPGGLLEGRCREPRGGVESGLDQAEQHGLSDGRLAGLAQRPWPGRLYL